MFRVRSTGTKLQLLISSSALIPLAESSISSSASRLCGLASLTNGILGRAHTVAGPCLEKQPLVKRHSIAWA